MVTAAGMPSIAKSPIGVYATVVSQDCAGCDA